MIKEKKYKIEIDCGSPFVEVFKDIPVLKIWYFIQAYPEYKKYVDPNCNRGLRVYKHCKVGFTALWKLVDALTYTLCSSPCNLKRDMKDLHDNFGVNISSEMYKYLYNDGKGGLRMVNMYRLNDRGVALRYKLQCEPYPAEELEKKDRIQQKKYLKAVEMSKKLLADYNNWEIESAVAHLE